MVKRWQYTHWEAIKCQMPAPTGKQTELQHRQKLKTDDTWPYNLTTCALITPGFFLCNTFTICALISTGFFPLLLKKLMLARWETRNSLTHCQPERKERKRIKIFYTGNMHRHTHILVRTNYRPTCFVNPTSVHEYLHTHTYIWWMEQKPP